MTIYDGLFPLGFGTNRFDVEGMSDQEGISRAADVLVSALNAGVSYVDVADNYSRGCAEEICRLAFARAAQAPKATVKISFQKDQTAEAAMKKTELCLKRMGLTKASWFVCWNISSYEQYLRVIERGSVYDGAVRAKERGLIDHICFSTHAPPHEVVRMLRSGRFEGVTIPLSVLNAQMMKPVLDCAAELDIGVVVMNPLGGGIIPDNPERFRFLCADGEVSPNQAALRYVYAHPAVKVVLSGMRSQQELAEDLTAFREQGNEAPQERIARVDAALSDTGAFCTGCHYCDGCPRDISVSELMRAYNVTLFPVSRREGEDQRTAETREITTRLKNVFSLLPESAENPCVACGRCEKKCTAPSAAGAQRSPQASLTGDMLPACNPAPVYGVVDTSAAPKSVCQTSSRVRRSSATHPIADVPTTNISGDTSAGPDATPKLKRAGSDFLRRSSPVAGSISRTMLWMKA